MPVDFSCATGASASARPPTEGERGGSSFALLICGVSKSVTNRPACVWTTAIDSLDTLTSLFFPQEQQRPPTSAADAVDVLYFTAGLVF
jgi:hypothetical protein